MPRGGRNSLGEKYIFTAVYQNRNCRKCESKSKISIEVGLIIQSFSLLILDLLFIVIWGFMLKEIFYTCLANTLYTYTNSVMVIVVGNGHSDVSYCIWLFIFSIVLKPLGKIGIQLFSLDMSK